MMSLYELLEQCAAREAVMLKDGLRNGDRLTAVLNEYDPDEVLTLGEVMTTSFINMVDRDGPIQAALIAWLMGMEMGREIERRMP